jgi:hypothetical protein
MKITKFILFVIILVNFSCISSKNKIVTTTQQKIEIMKSPLAELILEYKRYGLQVDSNIQLVSIDSALITELGEFNYLSEILDIGFTPNTIYYNYNFIRLWYSTILLYRIESISKGIVQINSERIMPSVDYDAHAIINGEALHIKSNNENTIQDEGLKYVSNYITQINDLLEEQQSEFTLILFKCRNQHQNPYEEKSGNTLRNYRIACIPVNVLNKLLVENRIKIMLPKKLNSKIPAQTSYNKSWGHNLNRISELSKKDHVLSTNYLNYDIKSNIGRYLSGFIKFLEFNHTGITFNYSDNQEIEFTNVFDLPTDDYNKILTIKIKFEDKEFKYTNRIENISKDGYSDLLAFLNETSIQSDQKFRIEKILNDDETYESSKSLIELHPFDNVRSTTPQLTLLNAKSYRSSYSPYIKIPQNELRLYKLGYIQLFDNNIYSQFLK